MVIVPNDNVNSLLIIIHVLLGEDMDAVLNLALDYLVEPQINSGSSILF